MSDRRLLIPLLALTLASCRDTKVEAYSVPREKDPEPPQAVAGPSQAQPGPEAGAPMAATAVPVAGGQGLAWTAPAGWSPKPGSAMRKGSYAVPGEGGEADLSITAFPGDVGGELANVNRWRGQLGLPELAGSDLTGAVTRLSHDGLQFAVVDFGSGGKRIAGAIVPWAGGTWFFKLMGPDSSVEQAKPAFLAFLQTVRPGAP